MRLLLLLVGLSWAVSPEQNCFNKVTAGDYDLECLKLLFSKALGYGMVVASLMLKLPQIQKILASKSIEGISLTSFYFETLGFSLQTSYNVHMQQPFSTYGENVIITVQCLLQCVLYWSFAEVSKSHVLKAVVFFFGGWCLPLFLEVMPENFWPLVPIIGLGINLVVKGTQIYQNFKNKSTGQLSFITNFLNLAGTAARMLTTFIELSDSFLLLNYGVGSLLNLTIVLQMLVYWKTSVKQE